MGLYCTNCRNPVPEGVNQCRVCNNGFVHQLACERCGQVVVRGAAACPQCGLRAPQPYVPYDQPVRAVARRPQEYDRSMTFGEIRDGAGRFGAISDVTVPDGVAGLMGDISYTVQTLLSLASKLATVAGTERSRDCIRGCRDLASRLQEELETRRGPG